MIFFNEAWEAKPPNGEVFKRYIMSEWRDIGVEWLDVWLEEESRGRQTVPKLVKPVMPGDLS